MTISTEQNLALSSIGAGGALLIPATIAARDAARRSVSMNNMRQMGIAFKSYENLFHRYPARAIYSKDRKPLLSWRVAMLLFIGEDELYKQFNLDEPWDSEHNKKLIAKMPNIYQSPHDSNNEGKTCYLVPVGKGTMFEKTTGVKPAEITDGESNTIMLVEVAPEKSVVWTKPEDLDYDPEKPLRGFGSLDHGFFNAGFVDVSVRRIHSAMDPDFLKAMFTQAGGEKIGNTDGN